jgi:hypothetical protein
MGASKELFLQMREQEQGEQSGISFEHLLDAKKSNLSNAVKLITDEISSGNFDSLKGLILAVKGKTLFTDLEKSLRPLAEKDYLDKLEKNYSIHDVSVDQSPTKTTYDYTVCHDPEWNELSAIVTEKGEELKVRETFLKGLKSKLTIVNEDSGEVTTIYPPNKLQSDGLKITIKK